MKSQMKFEVNQSNNKVEFLDVSVIFENGKIKTDLYSKPTDAFLYLNKSSNHPKHVIKNIPKGQFIRLRRICSEKEDYFLNCEKLCYYFLKRGYSQRTLQQTIREVYLIKRETLLEDKLKAEKDPQMIFVCEWHPNLSTIPQILKNHFHLLENDTKTSKVFTSRPLVAYRRPKSIKNHVIKNTTPKIRPNTTEPCGKCILCKNIKSSETITNSLADITIKINDGGTCKSKNLIYAVRCKKDGKIYIGETGDTLAGRFGKHRYDIKSRPDNNELAEHFHCDHDLGDMEVMILQSGHSKSRSQREHYEDKWICRLQTL